MLLVIEGPDGAGKTTLAAQLQERFPGAAYTHHGPYQGLTSGQISGYLMSSLKPALSGGEAIVDRCWLSDPIYSPVFRGHGSRISPAHTRMLERSALQAGGVVVLCLPPYEVCLKAFLSGREEMLESDRQLRQVYDGYAAGLATGLPVVVYDWTTESLGDLLDKLDSSYANYPAPRVALLGDRPNLRTAEQASFHVPFVTFSGRGCSEWLATQLEAGGIRETDLEWFNAYDDADKPLEVEALEPGVEVIALGRNAQQWCADNKVAHHPCPHPQVHKRFYYNEPYPLTNILKEILNA